MRTYGKPAAWTNRKPNTQNKNEGHEEVQSDLLHEWPDWLQEFRENLVGESSPSEPWRNLALGHRDTSSFSHELPMESRANVEPGSGKLSVFTHFPKDPKLQYLLEDENNEVFLHKTCWYSRAQSGKFW